MRSKPSLESLQQTPVPKLGFGQLIGCRGSSAGHAPSKPVRQNLYKLQSCYSRATNRRRHLRSHQSQVPLTAQSLKITSAVSLPITTVLGPFSAFRISAFQCFSVSVFQRFQLLLYLSATCCALLYLFLRNPLMVNIVVLIRNFSMGHRPPENLGQIGKQTVNFR